MNVHVANIFWRLLQIPAFCLLPSKIRISNSSPLQGRRVNRLLGFWWWRTGFDRQMAQVEAAAAEPATEGTTATTEPATNAEESDATKKSCGSELSEC